MAAGGREKPDPDALHRTACRLGVSAAALAAASSAVTVAQSAAAFTHPTAAAGVGAMKTTGSLLLASIVKGSVIGLCVSGGAYVGLNAFAPAPKPAIVSPRAGVALASAERNAAPGSPSAPPAPSLTPATETEAIAERAPTRFGPAPSSVANLIVPEAAPQQVLPAAAPPNARFEDESPPRPAMDASLAGATQAASSHGATGLVPADARLAREITSLDRVRKLARQGNAAAAVNELDAFERSVGFAALRTESQLVRIDVLLSLARRDEAAAVARQLLAAGAPATQRNQLQALAGTNRSAGK